MAATNAQRAGDGLQLALGLDEGAAAWNVRRLGFESHVASLSAETELEFDPTRPEAYGLFGVHYVITPAGARVTVDATQLLVRGPYALWQVGNGGFVQVADTVGRGYSENGAPPSAGYRNGYRRGRLATAEGPIEYGVPQVADRAEPFASRVRAGLARRTAELERLAVEMFARGLSTRDIDEAFAGRDLSEFSVAYLFVEKRTGRKRDGIP